MDGRPTDQATVQQFHHATTPTRAEMAMEAEMDVGVHIQPAYESPSIHHITYVKLHPLPPNHRPNNKYTSTPTFTFTFTFTPTLLLVLRAIAARGGTHPRCTPHHHHDHPPKKQKKKRLSRANEP